MIGNPNPNPALNTCLYELQFDDRTTKLYNANTIINNVLDQVDAKGYSDATLHSIVDYKFDSNAVKDDDGYIFNKRTKKQTLRKTNAGVHLQVALQDGDRIKKTWLPLKEMKESHPIETAEFAKARGIDRKPAFRWWVNYTLKKRDAIIASVKSRLKKSTHKYGIEVPTSI